MGERKRKAAELHGKGYTCSQAVACSFCDLVNIEDVKMKEMVRKYSGGAYKVCGAVMATYVIENYLNGKINEENPAEWNKETEEKLKEIENRFKERNSTVICRELKGRDTGIVLRSCRGCVEDAAEILEGIILDK